MSYRRASIIDLAKALNVAPSTVSRALADHKDISEVTKQRVTQLAKEWEYQPNHLAAGLRSGRSGILGVLVPHLTGYFYPEVVHSITSEAAKAGWHVMICESNEDEKQEAKSIALLLNAQVEGILVAMAQATRNTQHFDSPHRQHIPLVFFDRVPPKTTHSAVLLDDYRGGYNLTAHLLEQGYRRIAYLTGPLHVNSYANRYQGYCDALAHYGMPVDEALTYQADLNLSTGRAAMADLLLHSPRPDAVLAAKDTAAVGAMQVLQEHSLRVPQDVAVASFSHDTFTTLAAPTLTNIDHQCAALGRTAVRLLLEQISTPTSPQVARQVILSPMLVVRASSLAQKHLAPLVEVS
jgi:LacI family transcriptional regulator